MFIVAALVEILEVESVIQYLIDRISMINSCAHLIFHNINKPLYHKEDIDALTHSGNRKLEEYVTVLEVMEFLFRVGNLLDPGIFLKDIEGKMMFIRKLAEDLILVSG